MKSTLKGVVRDHRLPRDYKFHFAQPTNSAAFWKNLDRYFVVRAMTKQNVAVPLGTLFVSLLGCRSKIETLFPSFLIRSPCLFTSSITSLQSGP